VVSFPQVSPPNSCIHVIPIRATCSAHLIILDLIARIIFGEVYRSLSFSYIVFSTPLLPRPLRSKYSPQRPILKHPQPRFLPQCERLSFTPIQNNRQNYNSEYLSLYVFG
jgi:hypothetical protein